MWTYLLLVSLVVAQKCRSTASGYNEYRQAHPQKAFPFAADIEGEINFIPTDHADLFDNYRANLRTYGSKLWHTTCNDLADWDSFSLEQLSITYTTYGGIKSYAEEVAWGAKFVRHFADPQPNCRDIRPDFVGHYDPTDFHFNKYLSAGNLTETCNRSWVYAAKYALEGAFGRTLDISMEWLYECVFPHDAPEKCLGAHPEEILRKIVAMDGFVKTGDFDLELPCSEAHITPISAFGTHDLPVVGLDVERLSIPNRSGLADMLYRGYSPMALIGIELKKMMFLASADMNTQAINENIYIRAGYDDPTLFVNVRGYARDESLAYLDEGVEGVWEVVTNVLPCLPLNFMIPMSHNQTDSNYVGIAAYVAGVKVIYGPTPSPPPTPSPTPTPTPTPTPSPTPTPPPTPSPTPSPTPLLKFDTLMPFSIYELANVAKRASFFQLMEEMYPMGLRGDANPTRMLAIGGGSHTAGDTRIAEMVNVIADLKSFFDRTMPDGQKFIPDGYFDSMYIFSRGRDSETFMHMELLDIFKPRKLHIVNDGTRMTMKTATDYLVSRATPLQLEELSFFGFVGVELGVEDHTAVETLCDKVTLPPTVKIQLIAFDAIAAYESTLNSYVPPTCSHSMQFSYVPLGAGNYDGFDPDFARNIPVGGPCAPSDGNCSWGRMCLYFNTLMGMPVDITGECNAYRATSG